jgi:hypothetical protein
MSDSSDIIKVKTYNQETINKILENSNLFKFSHENEDFTFVKKDSIKEVNFTINTLYFQTPHILNVKEEGIEFLGSEYDYFLYKNIKTLVIDSKKFIYATSLENESIINIKEFMNLSPFILSFLILIVIIILGILGFIIMYILNQI